MIEWPVCLAKALAGLAVVFILGMLVSCAVRICHPDDSSCWGSDRSMNRMDPSDLIRELSK